jgi:3-dehydroquinate dehydratase/shikimate dehydrogenase
MVPLPCEDVADAIDFARTLSLKGLAVTIPHKETLLAHLDETDDAVRAIGAANTVVFRDGKALGYNTDAAGFARALLAFLGRNNLLGMRVAILGAGGAARAIAYAIHRLGGAACIHARDIAKAEKVAAQYGFGSATLADLGSNGRPDLIVQCTSVGHGSTDPSDDPVPDYAFDGSEAVYDLVYQPETTPLMTRARAAGCRAESGMSMLRAQGDIQHRLFHAEVLGGGL